MRTIEINFAPRSLQRSLLRTPTWVWVLGGLGLMLCVSAGFFALRSVNQAVAIEANVRRLDAKIAARTTQRPVVDKSTISEGQEKAVNGAILQLNLPWRDLLDAVEAATPVTIALLSLEPDAKKRLLRGTAEAKDSDAMVGYIAGLKQQRLFENVVLTKHETNDQDPNRPLRFQFEAVWIEVAQ